MSRYYSEYDCPDDILDKYTSPALSSSEAMYDKDSTDSRNYGKTEDTIDALPPSSPINSTMDLQHRQYSTNSGYLSRAELFGRSSPDLSPSARPQSRGLKRIEERRVKGYPVPGGIFTPSILTRISQRSAQALSKRQLTQSLRGEYIAAYSSPILRSSRPLSKNSASRLRRVSPGNMQEIAGSGHGPRPTLESDKDSHFPKLVLPSRKEQRSPVPQTDKRNREWSLAEHGLRSTLSSVSPCRRTGRSRSSSWNSKLFVRHGHVNTHAPTLKVSPPKRPDTDAPSVTNNSSKDIWVANMQPEEHATQTQGENDSAKPPLAPSAGKASFHSSESGFLITDSLFDLRLVQDCDKTSLDLNQFSPKDAVSAIEAPDLPVQTFLSSPAENPLNQSSTPTHRQLSILAPIVIVEQEPRAARQYLSLSSIQVVAVQVPLAPTAPRSPPGLSIAGANAIIYGCITFAALRFMLINLGEDARTIYIVSDVARASLVGVILCVFVHLYDGDHVCDGAENILQGLRIVARDILQALLDVLDEAGVVFWESVEGADDEFQH
jgi:hypothetical protein